MKIPVIQHRTMLAVWRLAWRLVVIWAVFAGGVAPAHAQQRTEGITKVSLPWNMGKTEAVPITVGEIRLRWSFWTLLGEPVYSVVGDYRFAKDGHFSVGVATASSFPVCTEDGPKITGKPVTIGPGHSKHVMSSKLWMPAYEKSEILSTSYFRIFIKDPFWSSSSRGQPRGIYFDVMPDTLARQNSNDVTFGVPTSPSWNKTFKVGRWVDPRDDDPWLPAEDAKALFKKGVEVRDIEVVKLAVNMGALVSAYSGYLHEKCKPKEEKKKKDEPPKAQDAAATKPVLDMRAFSKSAGTAAKTADNRNSATKPTLDMALLTQGKPASAAGNSATPSVPPKNASTASDPVVVNHSEGKATTSLMLLIDASGSMGGKRITEAKRAARDAIRRAASSAATEFSVASFTGDCTSPQIAVLPFTQNAQAAERFIDNITTGGGTPLGPAVSHINRYMDANRAAGSMTQLIILLADGDDNCKDVSAQVAQLKREGILFRHETIGLETSATASAQLSEIASASGGNFHHAANAEQLAETFKIAMEKSRLMQMFGSFGKSSATASGAVSPKSSVNWDILRSTSK